MTSQDFARGSEKGFLCHILIHFHLQMQIEITLKVFFEVILFH